MKKFGLIIFVVATSISVSFSQTLTVTGSAATLPVLRPVEETKGSRYLFDDWAQGFVISPDGTTYKNPAFGFEYDKLEGGLLLTQDKKSVIKVDNSIIKSFTLYDKNNLPEVFILVPQIDPVHYVRVIADGSKFKIYKFTKTYFVKNNYHTDGIATSGNNYDEYVDDNTYFVLNVPNNRLIELGLKKKAVKAIFGIGTETYLSSNPGTIDDEYLRNLGEFVNK